MTDRLMGVDMLPRADAAPLLRDAPQASTSTSAEAPSAPIQKPLPTASRTRYVGAVDKAAALAQLDEQQVRGCTKCPLHAHRIQTVFGQGHSDAPVMFVGEGPGQSEDEQGQPFVGKAGQMLDKWIAAMGLSREAVYIANAVKCRPPNNRTPAVEEVNACRAYLLQQIQIVEPKVIVTLGGPATKLLLQTSEGITRIRGRWHTFSQVDPPIPVMPTFHPAFLLRAYSQENRTKIWDDLQQVMQRLKAMETPS